VPKYTVSLPVESKVFSIKDIGRLYAILFVEYDKAKTEHRELTSRLTFFDGEKQQLDGVRFSYLKSILDLKKVASINFDYRRVTQREIKSVSVTLRSGSVRYGNEVEISSTNKDWFSRVRDEISENLNSVKSQNLFWHKSTPKIYFLLRILFGYTLLSVLATLLKTSGYKDETVCGVWCFLIKKTMQTKVGEIFAEILLSYYTGFLLTFSIETKIDILVKETWPNIEFNFGPTDSRTARQHKRVFFWLCGAVVVPLILQAVFKVMNI
jgi:hypothetical protein